MALHPAEEATLRAFVVAAKRDRLLMLFGSTKRRKQARDALNHFGDWDPRCMQAISSSSDVLVTLRKAGAPNECHLISDDPALDGRDLPLNEAVSAAESYSFASVLCCVPGELAFFFDEIAAPRNRVLLRSVDKGSGFNIEGRSPPSSRIPIPMAAVRSKRKRG